jgi:hypothetical protein
MANVDAGTLGLALGSEPCAAVDTADGIRGAFVVGSRGPERAGRKLALERVNLAPLRSRRVFAGRAVSEESARSPVRIATSMPGSIKL